MSAAFKGRREDQRLVTGKGQYTDDWNLPGQAYGYFLRADRAHAEIVSLDTSEASAVPGVLGVFSGDDLAKAGYKSPRPLMHLQGQGRDRCCEIRTGPRSRTAASGSSASRWRSWLPRTRSPRRMPRNASWWTIAICRRSSSWRGAGAGGARVARRCARQPRARLRIRQPRRRRSAFAKADRVVRMKLHAQRISGVPMEPKSGLAAFDRQSGRFDIYMPTQGMSDIMKEFAHVTGLTPEQFRIHAKDVGGGFGVRNEVYPEFAALAFAARALDRPVKWTGTRSESLLSDHHGRGVTLSGELALDRDGHFPRDADRMAGGCRCLLVECRPVHQHGGGADLHGRQRLPHAGGLWTEPPRLHQCHADRALSRRRPSERVVSRERLVDEAARLTGIDRIELRRRNLLTKEFVSLQDADRRDLRQRRSRDVAGGGAARRRLGWLRAAARRSQETRQAARHRLRDLHRALRRSRPGGDLNQVRRQRPAAAFHSWRGLPGRGTRPCSPIWSPAFSACRRTRSRCGRAIRKDRRLSAPARSARAR